MNWTLSDSQVIPPQTHATVIHRERLRSLLDDVLEHRLFLVIAPAGYGKTTLLTDWVHARALPSCWYSLSEMDRNSHRFFVHFIGSLRQTLPSIGQESLALLESMTEGSSTLEQLVITLVHEISDSVSEDFVIILDDYHLVDQEGEINDFVSQFIQYVSDACHVVLSSRTLLGLPGLELMVARGLVSGLGYEELAFQPDEVQHLAETRFQRSLSQKEAVALAEMSEGWITGLLLSADLHQWQNGAQMRALRASGVDLFAYFAQQVLDTQAPHVREFLLRTSMLDEFDAAFCATVFAGDTWVQDVDLHMLVAHLRKSNLFVNAVGPDGERVRYHALFQDFLRTTFMREKPAEVADVAYRLANTYACEQRWEQAHELFHYLGDVQAQVRFLEEYGEAMLRAGRMQLLVRWINDLPPLVKLDHTLILALHGASLILTGATDYGVAVLTQVERILGVQQNTALLIRVLGYRSTGLRMLGRYNEALSDADRALDLAAQFPRNTAPTELRDSIAQCKRIKGTTLYMMGDPEHLVWLEEALTDYQALRSVQNCAVVSMEIGLACLSAGDFHKAEPLFEAAAASWRSVSNTAGLANVLNNLGYLYYLRGDYLLSATTLLEALHAAQRSGYRRIEAYVLTGLGDILAAVGLDQAAGEIYAQAQQLATTVSERFVILYIELAKTRLAYARKDWEAAYEGVNRAGELVLDRDSDYEWSLYRVTVGRLYLAQGRFDRALEPLEDAVTQLSKTERTIDLVVAQLFFASALWPTDPEKATQVLTTAARNGLNTESVDYVLGECIREDVPPAEMLTHGTNARGGLAAFAARLHEVKAKTVELRSTLRDTLFQQLAITSDQPAGLVLHALGRPEVFVGGRRIANREWTVLAARDLLFCLLAHSPGLTKEQIGLLFWPDCTIDQLRSRFKNTLYRLRSALPDGVVQLVDDVYSFNRSLDHEYDVERFLAGIQIAEQSTDISERVSALRTAIDLYGGPYLAGVDAVWAIPVREQLQQIFLEAGTELASLYLELDQATEALACCQRVLTEDPCSEPAYRLSMRIHAALGNRSEIVAQFEKCRSILEEEIGVEPSPQTVDLFQELVG